MPNTPVYFTTTAEGPTGELTPKEILKSIQDWQEKQQRKIEAQRKELLLIRWIMVAVIIVLLIAFIGALLTVYGIIQDYITTKVATYQELINKVNEQSIKIDLLLQQLKLKE